MVLRRVPAVAGVLGLVHISCQRVPVPAFAGRGNRWDWRELGPGRCRGRRIDDDLRRGRGRRRIARASRGRRPRGRRRIRVAGVNRRSCRGHFQEAAPAAIREVPGTNVRNESAELAEILVVAVQRQEAQGELYLEVVADVDGDLRVDRDVHGSGLGVSARSGSAGATRGVSAAGVADGRTSAAHITDRASARTGSASAVATLATVSAAAAGATAARRAGGATGSAGEFGERGDPVSGASAVLELLVDRIVELDHRRCQLGQVFDARLLVEGGLDLLVDLLQGVDLVGVSVRDGLQVDQALVESSGESFHVFDGGIPGVEPGNVRRRHVARGDHGRGRDGSRGGRRRIDGGRRGSGLVGRLGAGAGGREARAQSIAKAAPVEEGRGDRDQEGDEQDKSDLFDHEAAPFKSVDG